MDVEDGDTQGESIAHGAVFFTESSSCKLPLSAGPSTQLPRCGSIPNRRWHSVCLYMDLSACGLLPSPSVTIAPDRFEEEHLSGVPHYYHPWWHYRDPTTPLPVAQNATVRLGCLTAAVTGPVCVRRGRVRSGPHRQPSTRRRLLPGVHVHNVHARPLVRRSHLMNDDGLHPCSGFRARLATRHPTGTRIRARCPWYACVVPCIIAIMDMRYVDQCEHHSTKSEHHSTLTSLSTILHADPTMQTGHETYTCTEVNVAAATVGWSAKTAIAFEQAGPPAA